MRSTAKCSIRPADGRRIVWTSRCGRGRIERLEWTELGLKCHLYLIAVRRGDGWHPLDTRPDAFPVALLLARRALAGARASRRRRSKRPFWAMPVL